MRIKVSSVLFGLALLVACGGESTIEETDQPASNGEPVSVTSTDSVTNDIPQNISLRLVDVGGTIHVENDGNVTMSGVAVTDGSGQVCSAETLAPGATAECAAATSPYSIAGSGPQGQEFSVTG